MKIKHNYVAIYIYISMYLKYWNEIYVYILLLLCLKLQTKSSLCQLMFLSESKVSENPRNVFRRFMNILIITSFLWLLPSHKNVFFLHLIVKCYGNQYRVVNKDTQSWSSYRASVFMVKYRYITYTKISGTIIEKQIQINYVIWYNTKVFI